MKGASIGVKLADRTFFPILEENSPASKELDITTVRDNQTMVQVNLYKSPDDSMENAEYIGTLMVDNLLPKASGAPTIRLMIELDANNELSAIATDLDTGNRNSLSVSLTSLHADDITDFPDFSFPDSDPEVTTQFDSDLDDFDDIALPEQLYERQEKSKHPKILLIVLLCLLIILLLVFVFLFVTGRNKKTDETAVQPPVTEQAAPPIVEPPPAPVMEPPLEAAPPAEPPQEEQVPSPPEEDKIIIVEESVVAPIKPDPPAKAPEPVRYRIKWGDTLWDIAKTYYKNPWLYPEIARANGIKNPDRIISGTWILIPPR